jgi:hypothetical protein
MFDKLSSYLHALQQTITLVVTMLDQLSVEFQALQQTSTQPTSALNYSKLQLKQTTAISAWLCQRLTNFAHNFKQIISKYIILKLIGLTSFFKLNILPKCQG